MDYIYSQSVYFGITAHICYHGALGWLQKNHNHVLRHFLYVLFEKSEKECRAILKNNESPLPDEIHSDKRACLKKYVHNTCTTTQWTFS